MPHLKVSPFEQTTLEELDFVEFRAIDSSSQREIFQVNLKNNRFIFEMKTSKEFYLIKPSRITRPLDVELIKEVLGRIRDELSLSVIDSNITLSPKKPKIALEFDKSIKDFIDVEFGFENISLEVGFGSGKHLLFRAKESPDTLFIGVEIHTPSAQQVLKQIELQNIKNIWVVNYDARLLLEMLPSNILSRIYVHFPVPWDKKPHRRVISKKFLDEAIRTLKVDGELELRTDSQKYYFYSLEIFSSPGKVEFRVDKNRELEVISKYEARWRRQSKDIYTVTLKNSQLSKEKNLNYSFEFEEYERCDVDSLKSMKFVAEDYFVSIQRVYKLSGDDKSGVVLELSFGSFERPESKYLLIRNSTAEYIPDIPVPIETNFKAHNELRRILWQA